MTRVEEELLVMSAAIDLCMQALTCDVCHGTGRVEVRGTAHGGIVSCECRAVIRAFDPDRELAKAKAKASP